MNKQRIESGFLSIMNILSEYKIRDIQKEAIEDVLERVYLAGYNKGIEHSDAEDCFYLDEL